MSERIGAVIMMGGGGNTPQERFVTRAKQAATIDLINLLQLHQVAPIILCTPNADWVPLDTAIWISPDPTGRAFHFGDFLAEAISANGLNRVLYFGGASAPLIDHELMGMLIGLVRTAGTPESRIPEQIVLTNNLHSSDWAAITHAQDILHLLKTVNQDNSLAWQLQNTGKYEVRTLTRLRPSAEFDIDTPTDVALLRYHPFCPPFLAMTLAEFEEYLATIPVQPIVELLRREGSHLALIGRVAPKAWEALSKQTKTWIRVYSEERGMVASERAARGEVRSLLGYLLEAKGTHAFFKILSELTEGAIIDTRVLMAHQQREFSDADRFASDLYMVDQIQDGWLRDFTAAAKEAAIPILLGGHSIVAGGLYILIDLLNETRSH